MARPKPSKSKSKSPVDKLPPKKQLPSLRLEWRNPAELAENPRNWRRHPEAQLAALGDVIAEVGWAGACLFNERTGRLVDGHARQKIAVKNGSKKVPVLIGSWDEATEAKILATLDPIAAMATADAEALDALLKSVSTDSPAVNQMLEELLAASQAEVELPAAGAGGDEFDATPAASGPTRTQVGDLWVIGGKHRLLVGDCTDAGNVARLMDGKKAGCVLTDPPYGQNQDGVSHDAPEELDANIAGMAAHLPADGIAVLFQSPRTLPTVLDTMRETGWKFERMLWLYKTAQNAYPWRGWLLKSEAILVFSKGTAEWIDTHPYTHDTYQVSEVSGEIPDGLGWHGSVKPLAIVRDILSRIGGLVYDPFLGSGTTLIAAHRLGRVCYGCEIECRYADVVLKRAEAEGLTVEKVG